MINSGLTKWKKYSYLINAIFIVAVYLIFNNLFETKTLSRYWQGIVKITCINIILVVSLNLTTGFLGELALGHAGFMAVGAYAGAIFSKSMQSMEVMSTDSAMLIGLVIGGIAAALCGVLIGIPALRLKGDYLAIITLGFGEIIRVIITNLSITGGARGLSRIPRVTNFTYAYFIMVAVIILTFTLGRSRHGRAIISIREDEIAAEASGIPSVHYKVFVFTLAAFFAGIAGGLYAHHTGMLDPKGFGFFRSIELLVMVVLGGMGSITGSVIAASVLTVLPELLREFSEYRMLVYSVVLIVVMIARPKGLMGTNEISVSEAILKPFMKKEKNALKTNKQ